MKRKYEPEGFVIIGIFGSYSRGEQTQKSDIDILFEMNSDFILDVQVSCNPYN
jgi:predicted nucleotidyltransferase